MLRNELLQLIKENISMKDICTVLSKTLYNTSPQQIYNYSKTGELNVILLDWQWLCEQLNNNAITKKGLLIIKHCLTGDQKDA